MRKYLGVVFILSTIFLVGCGKEISKEFLVNSNGKLYEKGAHVPYSGTVLNDTPQSWANLPLSIANSKAKISCVSRMIDGVYDGPVSCKDDNTGNLVLDFSLKNGRQNGKRTVFNAKTKDLIQVSNWENGIANGDETLYLDGKKLCETEYKNGEKHGRQVCWGAVKIQDTSTWNNTYNRIKVFKDDEKTIDAFFENGEIKKGLMSSSTPIIEPSGKVSSLLVIQQEFSEGKKGGKMEAFKLPADAPMNRLPFAEGKFENGLPTGKFTWYARDGKSICAEKTYENGSKVSGLLNKYSSDGSFFSQIKLVKHDTVDAFVLDGNEKILQSRGENKDNNYCEYACKTTEKTWDKGVILKSVTTDYGKNFESVENIATQELIKESVIGNQPSFEGISPVLDGFCSETEIGYVSDIVVINHKLYTSKIIDYANNVPKEEIICPYGATDATYAQTALSMGVGCTEKSLISPGNQEQEHE